MLRPPYATLRYMGAACSMTMTPPLQWSGSYRVTTVCLAECRVHEMNRASIVTLLV